MSLIIVVAALLANPVPAEGTKLIFEFPDGARGGVGHIQGAAASDASENTIEIIRRCGARDVISNSQISHRIFFIADSTRSDGAIVACVQKTTWRDFSVGVGHWGPDDILPASDETSFRKYWVNSKVPLSKAE